MPKTPKRPRDFSQAAKLVVDIASGEVEDRSEKIKLAHYIDPARLLKGLAVEDK
jgi:hypothetical protein